MADPLLDFMNADDEPSAAEAQAALAAALRRKKDLGTLGVLSGGKLAVPGQSLLGSARSDEESLMHAGVSRTARLDRQNAAKIAGMHQLEQLAAKKAEQARLDSQFNQRLAFDEKKLAVESKRHMGGGVAGGAPGIPGAPLQPKTYRDQLRGNAISLRPDEELIDPAGIGYRDPDQAKKSDLLRGNLTKLAEHRQQANDAMAKFKAAKTAKEADDALVALNVAMSNAASMTRQSEQMGASVDAQHTIDEMLSLTKGDVKNWKNIMNSGRIDAALGAAVNSAHANVTGQLGSMNVRIKAAKAAAAAHPDDSAAVQWAKANPADPRAAAILKANGQ